MSDPGLIAAKLTAANTAIHDYIDSLPDVTYLGIHVKIKDHVSDDQVSELSALVVDAVDGVEQDWAAAHPSTK